MDLRLDGQSALVTGSSRGIGLAIARRLCEAGANVMLTSRRAESLARAAADMAGLGGEVAWCEGNAGSADDAERCVTSTIETFGRLDILVNNAATNPYLGPMIDIDAARMDKTVAVNLNAILIWSQLAWRAAMAEHGGSIINVASIGGLSAEPGIGWYNVTKAAVIHLTRQLSFELSPGVRVNALAPGLVKTDFARALWETQGDQIASRLPLKRLGEPDDIAKAAVFLASDASSWMTGQVMVIDGGALSSPSGGVA